MGVIMDLILHSLKMIEDVLKKLTTGDRKFNPDKVSIRICAKYNIIIESFLVVVDLRLEKIIGGCTVPHSRASTPDFSQVILIVLLS